MSDIQPAIFCTNKQHILYDAGRLSQVHGDLFKPDRLQQDGRIQAIGTGRGSAWFVDIQNQHWVLRHYLRGGLVARLNRDLYLGWQVEHSRSWQEWNMLARMHALGLPVPRPVAASSSWPYGHIAGLYRADIIVQRIENSQPLSRVLQQQALPPDLWQALGRCIRQFHGHDVFHADLNAHNILLDDQQKLHVIDFDRGRFTNNAAAKAGNVSRLLRSFQKLNNSLPAFHFSQQDWQLFLQAYADNTAL